MTQEDCKNTIDLFLLEKHGKCHYSLIKNFSRLLRSQITSNTNEVTNICKKCFTHFTKKDYLKNILLIVKPMKQWLFKCHPKNTTLRFQNYQRQLPIPFVIYADFECFTKPLSTCDPCPDYS